MAWTSPGPTARKGSWSKPIPQIAKPVPIPPPTGVNLEDPLFGMAPEDAIIMLNYIASKYGDRVRTGYAQYATTVGSGGVKTIVPYIGSIAGKDRLFGMATDGIYDVSASVATPSVKLSFPAPTSRSGQGIWTANTTIGGFFELYCDEEYGAYLYTESTDTWARILNTDITGVDPHLLCFAMIFKSRIWFIQRDTASAWYLPVGTNIGAATQFNFGNKFRHGGTLQALYNWTLDGGIGVDDYLVAISSSGEVIIYKGDDPTDATNFSQVGSWFIGAVPVGRRIAGTFGGDLYILSTYGLQPISKLVQGTLAQVDNIELTRKISPAIQQVMALTLSTVGWEVKLVPSENALFVASPDIVGAPHLQFVQALNNQGWSMYNSLPMFTGEMWHGTFYMGALDGNVYTHTGTSDNFPRSGVGTGTPILAAMLTSFQDYQEYGLYHMPKFVRPVFLGSGQPSYQVNVLFDYNLTIPPSFSLIIPPVGAVWDLGIWDLATWTGDLIESEPVVGEGGIGRAMAIALQTSTIAPTTLIRFDAMAETGGFL